MRTDRELSLTPCPLLWGTYSFSESYGLILAFGIFLCLILYFEMGKAWMAWTQHVTKAGLKFTDLFLPRYPKC